MQLILRDLTDINSPDLKNELLVEWASPAFGLDGEYRLKKLELKQLCLLIDNIIHENVLKDMKFVLQNGEFLEDFEGKMKNCI